MGFALSSGNLVAPRRTLIGVWRIPSIYIISRISGGERGRGREEVCVCHPPSGAEGGESGVTHPFLPQGCAALALPHSLLLYPAGNVGRVEEVMSVLRGVESIDEGGAA